MNCACSVVVFILHEPERRKTCIVSVRQSVPPSVCLSACVCCLAGCLSQADRPFIYQIALQQQRMQADQYPVVLSIVVALGSLLLSGISQYLNFSQIAPLNLSVVTSLKYYLYLSIVTSLKYNLYVKKKRKRKKTRREKQKRQIGEKQT